MNIPQAPSRAAASSTRLHARARVGLTHGSSATDDKPSVLGTIGMIMSIAGGAIGVYHGYGRNRGSIWWALGWGALGSIFPVIVIPLALIQGLGKPARK